LSDIPQLEKGVNKDFPEAALEI